MGQLNAKKNSGEYFIRVFLSSGTRSNPLGDEELAIFCRCNSDEPSIEDLDKKSLVRWVNTNPACKKNQSNESYRVSKNTDAISVIFLNDREIHSCQKANRIYPDLVQS